VVLTAWRFVANNMSMLHQLTLLGAGIGIIDTSITMELVAQGSLVLLRVYGQRVIDDARLIINLSIK
jgi:DNA-binding transcriptional LysR family regulator